jgi:hypothetical protein
MQELLLNLRTAWLAFVTGVLEVLGNLWAMLWGTGGA